MKTAFIDRVFDTLSVGVKEKYRVPGVEFAYESGHICMENYKKAYDAYDRLRERLGVENEDDDIEEIFDAFLCIEEEIGKRMYRYGAEFGLNGERFTGTLVDYPTQEETFARIMRGELPEI